MNWILDRFASIAAKIILCTKGLCEVAAPIGIVFGGMAGIDELRKAKGLEPILIPKIADYIFTDNDTTKQIKEMRSQEALLANNNKEIKAYKEENDIVNAFEKNGIIDKEEADAWRNKIKNNEFLCQVNSKEIKSKILDSLDKLNEIRKNK